MFLLLATWPLTFAARAQPCATSTSPGEVDTHLAAAESAYWQARQAPFEAEVAAAREALICVGEVVTPALAARFHRVEGLSAWLRRDAEETNLAFAAARWLDQGYQFPLDLPVEAPERAVYERLSVNAPRTVSVPAPSVGSYAFDGERGVNRPGAWPTLFQRLDEAGRPEETRYLSPEEALPEAPEPEVTQPKRRQVARWILGGASLGLLTGGAVVYGTGRWGYAQDDYTHLADTNPDDSLEYYWGELYPRMAIGVGMAAVGGVGLLGTGAWVVASPQATTVGLRGRW